MNPGLARLAGALPACFLLAAAAANGTAEPKADLLYAPPDASAPGEIRGTVAAPARPLEKVLAIPAEDPRRVYRADIEEPDKRAFRFRGLPMDRYDLIAIYEDAFYEGLRLTREENSLTASDVSEIDAIIQRSEPFFTHKIVHRLAGTAGRGGDWRLWDGPNPFTATGGEQGRTGYTLDDARAVGATQLCSIVADPDHAVVPGTGNCIGLPEP